MRKAVLVPYDKYQSLLGLNSGKKEESKTPPKEKTEPPPLEEKTIPSPPGVPSKEIKWLKF
ncbi:hypothetical protein BOW09_12270 [Solemya velum gill symbiont]|uniref:hypothetical protein n=1 Tax=Solemya velum gill symbiont TaxID=2340 RepID=UPI000996B980|nr:hypothetical protein [Solemya velum gill symbiont]OOY49183.1 hypothetical protein BOV97_13035 [Solemya velum gill symbiont]OOY72078.1 hypothetical protein BOW09_12270 [Solemya velum gill symbiont]OOY92482.1 hypothetical protein BOW17_12385 [Solemya velum gill symbiont]OOY98653.1 hypothetical protein BOW20_11570 [Solemya velum gill symbiont]OOZ10161.1 hypothetical protein BOW25_13260 [Solemya velum gill symbiont]